MSGRTDPGDNHVCEADADGKCTWCGEPMTSAMDGLSLLKRFGYYDANGNAPPPSIPGDDIGNLAHSLLFEGFLAGARPIATDVPDSVVRRAQAYADANWRDAARRIREVVTPVVVSAVESAVTQMAERTSRRIDEFAERQATVLRAFVVRTEELLAHRMGRVEPAIDEREGHQ